MSNPEHADIVFEGVTLWSFRGSRLAAQGTGQRLVYRREGGSGQVVGPHATIYPADPAGVIDQVESASGTGSLATKVADAAGHVVLTRPDGSAVTEAAHFQGDAHHLSGQQPIDVVTGRLRIHGLGFQADTLTEVADFDGPVSGDGRVRR